MNDNEPSSKSKRARKLTAKGQEYADARAITGAPAHGSVPSAKKSKTHDTVADKKGALSGKARSTAFSTSKAKPKNPEFVIEALPSNRTSQKSNTINFQAHAHSMPRPSSSTTARVVSGERQKLHPTPVKVTHRLTQEKVAQLVALRNPYHGKEHTASAKKTGKLASFGATHAVPRGHTTRSASPLPAEHQQYSADEDVVPQFRNNKRARSPDEPTQADDISYEDDRDDQTEAPQRLRTYHLSNMSHGQIPMNAGRHRQEINDDDHDGDHDDDNDYASQPRREAHARAYNEDYDNEVFYDERDPEAELSDNREDNNAWETRSDASGAAGFEQTADDQAVAMNDDIDDLDSDQESPKHALYRSRHSGQDSSLDHRLRKAQRIVPVAISDDVEGNAERRAKSRPRAQDYEPEAQEVIKSAAVLYKSKVMTQTAYPEKLTEKTWASDAWRTAASQLDIELAPNSEIISLLTRYSWNLRGELKLAARGSVRGEYGFKAGTSHATQAANRRRATKLCHASTFTYETVGDTPELNEGLYEAEIIQSVIDQVFYKSPEDDGITCADVYDPFPVSGLALVLAAIECAIDEWQTGAYVAVTFSEEAYRSVYNHHLEELNAFEAASGEDHILRDIRAEISRRGRYHAKAPIAPRKSTAALSATALSDAVASYKRRKADAARGVPAVSG